jgi:hypothetical protein
MGLDSKVSNADEKIQFGECELFDGEVEGVKYTARKIFDVCMRYKSLVSSGKYQRARMIEGRNHYPVTWLNMAITEVVKEVRNRTARSLVAEFSERGFSNYWLSGIRKGV